MQRRRDLLTAGAGVGALALAAACAPRGGGPTPGGGAKASSGGTVTFVLENDVINFDPLLSRAFVDRNVLYQCYDSLVRIDPSGKIIPWLAEKWDTAADGKAVTFTLHQGVKYHDGTPFDAESVKWNIDRYRLTEGSFRRGELAPVDGHGQRLDVAHLIEDVARPAVRDQAAPGQPGLLLVGERCVGP